MATTAQLQAALRKARISKHMMKRIIKDLNSLTTNDLDYLSDNIKSIMNERFANNDELAEQYYDRR